MEERAKKVVHITHAMEMLKTQLDNHNSGVKVLAEKRVTSLKNRLQSYKGQIYDASRELSEEVCCVVCVACFPPKSGAVYFWWASNLMPPCYFAPFSDLIFQFVLSFPIIRKLTKCSGEVVNFRSMLGMTIMMRVYFSLKDEQKTRICDTANFGRHMLSTLATRYHFING